MRGGVEGCKGTPGVEGVVFEYLKYGHDHVGISPQDS